MGGWLVKLNEVWCGSRARVVRWGRDCNPLAFAYVVFKIQPGPPSTCPCSQR